MVDSIKNFFGIRSPSTLFAGLGFNTGEGIGVGFEKAMDGVARDMQNAIPTGFDMNVGMRGYGDSPTSAGSAITQNISVVSPKALSEKELAREFRTCPASWRWNTKEGHILKWSIEEGASSWN